MIRFSFTTLEHISKGDHKTSTKPIIIVFFCLLYAGFSLVEFKPGQVFKSSCVTSDLQPKMYWIPAYKLLTAVISEIFTH